MFNCRSDVPSCNTWAAHVARCFGFSWATILVPGGDNGVVLKSNCPNTFAYADIFLFRCELRRRLRMMVDWWISQHHRCMVKRASNVLNQDMKCALNVRIALSVALGLWMCGGTSWYWMFSLRCPSFGTWGGVRHL
jgi:hypothetical protein